MARKHSPDVDDSGDQSDEYSERFETIEAKAREALKHNAQGRIVMSRFVLTTGIMTRSGA